MKRFISYFIVFIIGFAVCAWVIHYFYGSPTQFAGIESTDKPRGGVSIAELRANEVRRAGKIAAEYVVNIDTEGQPRVGFRTGGLRFPGFPERPFSRPYEYIPKGQASGVIFRPDGYILTNNHVVSKAEKLFVTLHSDPDKQYPAKLIGRDPTTDLAVVKIDAKNLKYAKFGNSDTLEVGDWVIAVGNALGLGPTVTIGVISALQRDIPGGGVALTGLIQTDAAINLGNSGGALADINGNLVGVNTAIAQITPEGGNIGIGFAIPSNTAKNIAEQLVKHGKIIRPYLGIRYGPLNEQARAWLRQQGASDAPPAGVFIAEVYSASPAAEAGLQRWDVITKVNGKPVTTTDPPEKGKATIAGEVGKSKVGDRLNLEVWHHRTGRVGSLAVRIGEMPVEFGEQP